MKKAMAATAAVMVMALALSIGALAETSRESLMPRRRIGRVSSARIEERPHEADDIGTRQNRLGSLHENNGRLETDRSLYDDEQVIKRLAGIAGRLPGLQAAQQN